ncbi:MAG: hypothetical protein ABMB14_05600 [Myxococcota bacterium]
MRKIRIVLVAAMALGALGCSGLGQKLLDMSGADVKVGADATLPAGFPLNAPGGGTLMTSASMDIAGMTTSTVVYEITDGAGLLDGYEQQMKDAGLTTIRSSAGGADSVTGNNATTGENWTASITDSGGKKMLSLVVLQKGGA